MRSRRRLLGAFLPGLLSRANAGEEFGYETIDCPILWIAEREGNEREAVLAYGADEGLLAGRLFVKVIATRKPLDFKAMQAAPDPPTEILKQMQGAFPGGAADLLSTDGWADDLVWFDFK